MGWPEFIEAAQLAQIGPSTADPGNPGHTLTLYDLPEQIFDEPVRILLCTNATVERDGTRRRFGLTVPATVDDPITAAAWTFNVPVHVYKQLARAC